MNHMIDVIPAQALRRDFAVWAIAQVPKIRTVSSTEFAVPASLFTQVPEPLLIGALVDGHRYVSPAEDTAENRPAPGAPELLGVATAEGLTPPGSAAGAVVVIGEAGPEEVVPLDDLPEPDPGDTPQDTPEGVFPCPGCDREFTSARGLRTHQRTAHTDTEG
jgi:hypothetical protein